MDKKESESIVFGGGCFWCLDAVFRRVKGVLSIEVGYAGGDKENPTYEEVSSGKTGHAEVVKITYSPAKISLENLLEIFFLIHDPTSINKQGGDVGPQYRSVALYKDDLQRMTIGFFISQAASLYHRPIVTEVAPLRAFYPAESYHDDYFENHPRNTYCRLVIAPKIEKFKKTFENLYKD